MNLKDDEFASNSSRVFIKISNSLVPTSWFSSCGFIPGTTFVPTLIKYTNKNLQKVTKFALEFFLQGQEYGQAQTVSALTLALALAPTHLKSREQPFKTCFSKLYFGNLHTDYCNFCQ